MELPQPVSNTDVYLVAMIEKLEEIRIGLVDVESELQKLNTATQSTPKAVIQLDADKVADAISKAILVSVGVKTDGKRSIKS